MAASTPVLVQQRIPTEEERKKNQQNGPD